MISNRTRITDGTRLANKGFTMVETLVAITIVMITLVGPFQAVEHALTASYASRDELIGNSLAQEAVEYVLNVRDNNYLWNNATPGRSWTYGFDGTSGTANCITPNKCVVDPFQATIVSCPNNNCSTLPLYIASSGASQPYLYNQSTTGVPSRFTRSIQLCYVQSNGSCTAVLSNEAKLTVTVTWITASQTYNTTITEYLENWL